jgi:hypothetical protein
MFGLDKDYKQLYGNMYNLGNTIQRWLLVTCR